MIIELDDQAELDMFVGKNIEEVNVEKLKSDGWKIRVLPPKSMYTQDVRNDRLNFRVDDFGIVKSVNIG